MCPAHGDGYQHTVRKSCGDNSKMDSQSWLPTNSSKYCSSSFKLSAIRRNMILLKPSISAKYAFSVSRNPETASGHGHWFGPYIKPASAGRS